MDLGDVVPQGCFGLRGCCLFPPACEANNHKIVWLGSFVEEIEVALGGVLAATTTFVEIRQEACLNGVNA